MRPHFTHTHKGRSFIPTIYNLAWPNAVTINLYGNRKKIAVGNKKMELINPHLKHFKKTLSNI